MAMERRGFLGGLFAGAAGLIAMGSASGMTTEITKKIIIPDDPDVIDAVRNCDDLALMAAGISPVSAGELASGVKSHQPIKLRPSGDYDLIDPDLSRHSRYANATAHDRERWNANTYNEWLQAHIAVDRRFAVKVF